MPATRKSSKKPSKGMDVNAKKNGSSKAFYFGKQDPNRQEFRCDFKDYASLMKSLPAEVNVTNQWKSSGNSKLHPVPEDVTTWFGKDNHVAFYGPPSGSRSPLTYALLHEQIQKFTPYDLPRASTIAGEGVCVVALLLPPTFMAETGAVLMTLIAQKGICVAPIDPNMPLVKIEGALEQLQCTALITTEELFHNVSHKANTLKDIRFIQASTELNHVGAVDWTIHQTGRLEQATFDLKRTGIPAMLLRTSGTTSTPKIVPLTHSGLLYNAVCLAGSLSLNPKTDVGCNGMPLFHIGGIAANLMAVLVSGSSVVMLQDSFDGQGFFEALTTTSENGGKYRQPNWYSGVPSMHKAILLAAKINRSRTKTNRLRFIRSGAAHLPHGTAVEMAQVFGTDIYPTYSMSECMPICSSNDAPVTASLTDRKGVPDDTVGVPTGGSMAIVNEEGKILPYGQIGQVSIKGPGVVNAYIGIPLSKSHTPTGGWFLTGDMGQLDKNGRLVLSGRQKEMIKRGGDQVWPNEVDGTVESVDGVRLAVTFGVPNELWGEEVQVAVVLDNEVKSSVNKDALEKEIQEACTIQLGPASAPSKVHYVDSPNDLAKGNTGKFLRMKMADHLGATAVDTGALHALEQMAALAGGEELEVSKQPGVTPSPALNGMRFIVSCFVVWLHVSKPPTEWLARMQGWSANMIIFFILGGYQLVTSLKSAVKDSSSQFIGTKIGAMHSWFVISQLFALPAFLIGYCGDSGFAELIEGKSNCMEDSADFWWNYIANTLTGMSLPFPVFANNMVNGVTWFQQVFYQFLIIFPILDYWLRRSNRTAKLAVFWLTLFLGVGGWAYIHYNTLIVYAGDNYEGYMTQTVSLSYLSILSWFPTLLISMLAGYWFSEYASLQDPSPERVKETTVFQRPKLWGYVADGLSFFFLGCWIAQGVYSCVMVPTEIFTFVRPNSTDAQHGTWLDLGNDLSVFCDLTYEEWDLIFWPTMGRWSTEYQYYIGSSGLRLSTPFILVWIFALSYGRGITARIFNTRILQGLATLAYPIYLLHLSVARFYYAATRGFGEIEDVAWWTSAGAYPVPINFWELPIILIICIALAWPIERFVVRALTPYTISWGVWICKKLAQLICMCTGTGSKDVGDSTQAQVEHMVKGLTGNPDVDLSTKLGELGLDSLGATALLGALKSTVPNAKSLTMAQLSACETVGDLVSMLDGTESKSTGESGAVDGAGNTESGGSGLLDLDV